MLLLPEANLPRFFEADKCRMHWPSGFLPTKCLPGLVYVAQVGDLFKIGKTTKTIETRFKAIERDRKFPRPIIPVLVLSVSCCTCLEAYLHRVFFRYTVRVSRLVNSEYFFITRHQVEQIKEINWFVGSEVKLVYESET